MKKYIDELKKVTWPSQVEVFSYFWIVILGVVGIVLFTFIVDSAILELLNQLYT